MSGRSRTTTNSSQQNTFDPWVTEYGQNIVNAAGDRVNSQPWSPYTGPTSAAFGSGFDQANQFLGSQLGQTRPEMAQASGSISDLLSTLDPNRSVASYMPAYTDQVLAPTIRNINESFDARGGDLAREATMAGAYGDSAHGVRQSVLDRDRARDIGDATAGAYDRAFTSAVGQRDADLGRILSGASGLASIGQQQFGQNTSLAQMLAALGTQQQQAGQTGIQNDITLNQQNQDQPLRQFTSLAQILAMIPRNTYSQGTSTTSAPDNSGLAFLASLI